VCDLETSRIGAPYIYIYIYDISNLRVNVSTVLKIWKPQPPGTLRSCPGL